MVKLARSEWMIVAVDVLFVHFNAAPKKNKFEKLILHDWKGKFTFCIHMQGVDGTCAITV